MVIGVLLLVLAAAPPAGPEIPTQVAELVLAAQIDENPDDFVLCIKISGSDAPPQVLAKLQRVGRTIVPGSECRWVVQPDRGSYHKKSKRPAYILDLAHPKWISPSSLTVEVESQHHGKWANGRTVELALVSGQWRIVGVSNEWVS
jgi:hypothetical protein